MSYQGNIPASNFESPKKDRFTGISGTTCSLTYAVSSVADIIVWVNSVKQDFTNYSVSGNTLTLGGTLVSADIVEVTYVGRTFQSVNPSASSVGTNQLADDAVTAGKLSSTAVDNTNTNSTLITAQTEKSTLVDADKFLLSDSAASGALKYVQKSNLPSGTHVKLFTDTSPSGGAVNIGSSYITSTYTAYLLRVQNLSSDSDNWRLLMRHSTDNNSSSINNLTDTYYQAANSSHGSSTYSNNAAEDGLNVLMTHDDIGNGANEGLNGFAYLFIDTTKPKHGTFKFTHTNSNRVYMYQGAYYVDTNSTVNAINLRTSAGDFDGGLIELYGIV